MLYKQCRLIVDKKNMGIKIKPEIEGCKNKGQKDLIIDPDVSKWRVNPAEPTYDLQRTSAPPGISQRWYLRNSGTISQRSSLFLRVQSLIEIVMYFIMDDRHGDCTCKIEVPSLWR